MNIFNNESIKELKFLDTKDVAKILGCSIPTARDVMRRKNFPLVKVGRQYKVSNVAFEKWALNNKI